MLRVEEEGEGVVRLVKDDPATGNGISLAMADALSAALDRIERDAAIRAVVIDAAGKGFHGGAAMVEELKPDMAALDEADVARLVRTGQALGRRIAALPIPVIGVARRGAAGGGLELLLRCDVLYCLDRAWFGWPEVTLGFVAAWGGTQWGGRMLPMRRAQEMLLLGEPIDGATAAGWGLATRSFADMEALDAHVAAVLARLRLCAPSAYAWTKRSLQSIWAETLAASEEFDVAAETAALASRDFVQGYAAMKDGQSYDFVARERRGRPRKG